MSRLPAILLGIVVVLAIAGLAIRLFMGRPAEDGLQAGEDVAIRALRNPLPGNAFLACPPDYCAASAMTSPVFAMPADHLALIWRRLLAEEPNAVLAADEPAGHRLVAIQHTPLLRFPDIVTAEFVALGPGRSSIALYSRARYGRSDFGTNRKRVLALLERLRQAAGQ